MARFVKWDFRWLLAVGCAAVAFAAGWWTTNCRAQIDPGEKCAMVIYDDEVEVGRAYRDVAGDKYTEHWILYPNYRFDRIREPGAWIEIVAEKGGYASLADFLARAPFPKGSRYVVAECREFANPPEPDKTGP